MSREPWQLREPGDATHLWVGAVWALSVTLLVAGGVWVWLTQGPQERVMVVVGGVVLVAALLGALVLTRRARRGATRVDDRARYMATNKDVADLRAKKAEQHARQLGADVAGTGLPLGSHLPSRQRLYASWEWVQVWVIGPRAGKTTCVCVPQMLEARGPVLFTTNKLDGIPETKGPRSRLGTVWTHDVQSIVGEHPTWWWNPLTFVTDIARAEKLADVFITSATTANDKQDAYFSSAGKETLSRLLLAAALDSRPITDVFKWVNDETNSAGDDPARVLVAHGEVALADALYKTQNLTSRQRDGIYGTIRPWIAVLGTRAIAPWITNTHRGARPHFDPAAFVRSTDTLYLVSKEGGGTARAITAALTVAILTAAEDIASTQPNGRLAVPLTAVLDEVANVCRWRELPDVYSHYGSRGIVLATFFQSWAQGVEAFGENGMAKLWSAANIRVAGSGLSEEKFLRFVSELVGDRDVVHTSRSTSPGRGGYSRNESLGQRRILTIKDLGALPRGRAVLVMAGFPAVLLRLDHYTSQPYAQDVADSKKWVAAERAAATISAITTTPGRASW